MSEGDSSHSLSIPLCDIDVSVNCDSDQYLEEADRFPCSGRTADRSSMSTINVDSGEADSDSKSSKVCSGSLGDTNQIVGRTFSLPPHAREKSIDEDLQANKPSEVASAAFNDPTPISSSASSRQPQNDREPQEHAVDDSDELAQGRMRSLEAAIAKSKQSHLDLQNWDKKMGVKMSFSRTMSKTAASRVLVEQMVREELTAANSSRLSSRISSRTASTSVLSSGDWRPGSDSSVSSAQMVPSSNDGQTDEVSDNAETNDC